MRFVLERTSDPAIEPVTLAEIKAHVREFDDITANDTQLLSLVKNGREWVEDLTGRALIDQTWRLSITTRAGEPTADTITSPAFYAGHFNWARVGEIMLRRSPVLAITAFASVDADGVETTIDAATYALRDATSKWPRLLPLSTATFLSASELRVTFRAGYADRLGSPVEDGSVVPEALRQAIMLHAEAYFDRDPQTMDDLLKSAARLAKQHICHTGFA
jgi:uncharacterized phiE125 gp8 family phage protein